MKTNSPIRKSRRRIAAPGVAAALLCVLCLGALLLWREPFTKLLLQALKPVFAARNTLGASEAALLRAQLEALTARAADREALYTENLDLKRRLGREERPDIVLAGILMRPPGMPYDSLLIDAGEAQGVTAGDLVSAGGNALIGRVAHVYGASARVVLFSAPGENHDALLYRGEGDAIPVVLEGQGAGALHARVPAGTFASVGDAIVIPGVAGGLMARVSDALRGENETFETLHVHLPANPNRLRYVEVWRASPEAQP